MPWRICSRLSVVSCSLCRSVERTWTEHRILCKPNTYCWFILNMASEVGGKTACMFTDDNHYGISDGGRWREANAGPSGAVVWESVPTSAAAYRGRDEAVLVWLTNPGDVSATRRTLEQHHWRGTKGDRCCFVLLLPSFLWMWWLLSVQCYAMHGQNINLPVCLCVRHTFFLSTRVQVRPLNRFLQLIAYKTQIYSRMCLLGVLMMNNHICRFRIAQNPHFGDLNKHFKPNMRKI